jgi:ParB family chromosome partitioning protein
MNYSQIDVSISDIGDDDTFHISTNADSGEIATSIKAIGLINPPLCYRKAGFFQIVSGFRRVSACKQLGFSFLPIRVLSEKFGELELTEFAICDNLFQRKLNIVELSRAFNLLSRIFPQIEALAEEAKKLGLPSNSGFIKKTIPVSRFSTRIQNGILNDTIALSTAVELESMSEDDAAQFATVLNSLRLSLNKQREVLTLVKEIAARDGIPMRKIINDPPTRSLLTDHELDASQKAQKLRLMLRSRRFPRLTELEQRYARMIKDFKIPQGIQLIPPKYFEGTEFTLQIRFKNSNALRTHLKFSQKFTSFHPERLLDF